MSTWPLTMNFIVHSITYDVDRFTSILVAVMAMYKIAEVTEEGWKYGSYLPWEFPALSKM